MSAPVQQRLPPRASLIPSVLLGSISALATALRLLHIGQRSLWFDEASSVALAQLPWLELRKVLSNREANMTLYYLLLHFWVKLAESEAFVRGFSAICGALTVPLLFLLGRRLFGTRAGLIAATLLAVNGYHIRYSQEARSYSLVVLLVVASMLLFVKAVEARTTRCWAAYALVSVLAVYTHFFAALVIVSQYATLAFVKPHARLWRKLWRSALIIFVACLPLLWFALFKNHGQIDWIGRTTPRSLYDLFFNLAGHGGVLLFAAHTATAFGSMMIMILCLGRLSAFSRWRTVLMLAWLLLPIALTTALALRTPVFLPRYLIVVMPAFLLLIASGISWLKPAYAFALLSLLLALSLFGIRTAYGPGYDPPQHLWREATQYVISHSVPGDAIIFYHPFSRIPFEYYRRTLHAPNDQPKAVYPLRGDGALLSSATASRLDLSSTDSPQLQQIIRQQRVWFALSVSDDPQSEAIQQLLEAHFRHQAKRSIGITRLILYSK